MQCKLELRDTGGMVDHGTAFGRIAFSCPREQVKISPSYILVFINVIFIIFFSSVTFLSIPQLPDLEALMKKENQKILTPLVSLDTPGKATVEVVILADPVSASPS